jgi:hypothetical protein
MKDARHAAAAGFAALTVLLWLAWPKRFVLSDPAFYAARAHDLADIAQWPMDHPFDHRVLLLLLNNVSQGLFGATPFAAALPQLLALLAMLLLAFRLCRSLTERTAAAAVLLLLLPKAAHAGPDLPAAAGMFAALVVLSERRSARGGVLFAALAFLAFLVKMVAWWLIVPLLWALVSDLRRGAPTRGFHAAALISGALLGAGFLAVYAAVYGQPFLRFEAASAYQGHAWAIESATALARRLVLDPFIHLQGHFGPAALLAALGLVLRFREVETAAVFLIGGLLLLTFSSVSLAEYQPLPLDRLRIFAPLAPVLAVLAGKGAAALVEAAGPGAAGRRRALAAVALLFVAAFSAAHCALEFREARAALRSERHLALTHAAEAARRGPGALIAAEPRTVELFDLFAGHRLAPGFRVAACPDAQDIAPPEPGETLLLFADRPRARFLERAYGARTCPAEIEAAAKRLGARTVVDDGRTTLWELAAPDAGRKGRVDR